MDAGNVRYGKSRGVTTTIGFATPPQAHKRAAGASSETASRRSSSAPAHDPTLYRCSFCRCLLRGDIGQHGDRCPVCETGRLGTIARVTRAMLAQAEIADVADIGVMP